MKKLAIFLLALTLGSAVFAQSAAQNATVLQYQERYKQKIKEMEAYERFDFFYYNYALTKMRPETKKLLETRHNFRIYRYGTQRTNDEITQYRYYYEDEIKDARQAMREKNIQLNPDEEAAIQEYSKRPVTQAAMLADAEKYQAYETLVFNYIWGKLTGILAKSCLQQVKELRALAQNTANTARLEAQKKAIKQQISALALEERALIEEYLNMPVSRNGEAYYLFPQEQK